MVVAIVNPKCQFAKDRLVKWLTGSKMATENRTFNDIIMNVYTAI